MKNLILSDGILDGSDISSIDNDALNSSTDYINTDISGDEGVEINLNETDNNKLI